MEGKLRGGVGFSAGGGKCVSAGEERDRVSEWVCGSTDLFLLILWAFIFFFYSPKTQLYSTISMLQLESRISCFIYIYIYPSLFLYYFLPINISLSHLTL